MVMALSSTFREKEKVVSSILTVPTIMRFWGMVIPSSMNCCFKTSFILSEQSTKSSSISFLYQALGTNSACSPFLSFSNSGLRIGSVTTLPVSLRFRDSTTLRYSAKYCSTGARFISSKHKKYGVLSFSHARTTNFKKSPAINVGSSPSLLTYPISSEESCQLGFTCIISKFFGL